VAQGVNLRNHKLTSPLADDDSAWHVSPCKEAELLSFRLHDTSQARNLTAWSSTRIRS
jgi:hypothetical protein